MLRIYDLNNWVRVQMETDQTGLPIRSLYLDTQTAPCPVFWVADGPGGNARRREVYPLYKANREPPAENVFATMNLMKEIVKLSKGVLVEIPGFEADDVIAALATNHRDTLIFSTDSDLVQLQTDPTIRTIKGEFKGGRVPPKYVRAYKTLVGDTADNIKGVPGFGEKAFEKLDKEAFILMMITDDPEALEYLDLTKKAREWMLDNWDELRTMWSITGFFFPTSKEIVDHAVVGKDRRDIVDTIFEEFML